MSSLYKHLERCGQTKGVLGPIQIPAKPISVKAGIRISATRQFMYCKLNYFFIKY